MKDNKSTGYCTLIYCEKRLFLQRFNMIMLKILKAHPNQVGFSVINCNRIVFLISTENYGGSIGIFINGLNLYWKLKKNYNPKINCVSLVLATNIHILEFLLESRKLDIINNEPQITIYHLRILLTDIFLQRNILLDEVILSGTKYFSLL